MVAEISTNGHINGHANDKKKILRIAGASGGVFDRFRAMQDLARDPSIDGKKARMKASVGAEEDAVLFGDWNSEISMTFRGNERAS